MIANKKGLKHNHERSRKQFTHEQQILFGLRWQKSSVYYF